MSEIIKNIGTEIIQDIPHMAISKPIKQKHNSKRRRCKRNKAFSELEGDSESQKVDEVVNYLCSTIVTNVSETSLETNLPKKIVKESPKIEEINTDKIFTQNSKFINAEHPSVSSTQDLSGLFDNLQIQKAKNSLKMDNLTNVNIKILKKSKCETLLIEDLKNVKQKKLKENFNLDKEGIYAPDETHKAYLNSNIIGNSPGISILTSKNSPSKKLASEIKQTSYSPGKQENKKTEYLKKADTLLAKDNNSRPSTKFTPKFLHKKSEVVLKNEAQGINKRFKKKKAEPKKNSVPFNENDLFSLNQRIFLNSDFQKTYFSKPTTSEVTQPCKFNNKQQNQNSDTKFPKYLSSEELQSMSQLGVLLTGIIRINQKNYKEAYITAPDKGIDILIEGLKDRNRALDGDEVYFVLKPKEHHRISSETTDAQRTGVVVGIKTLNHNRGAIGSLNVIKNKNDNFTLFSPRDSRLPRIRIQKSNWPKGFSENSNNFKNRLYFARIFHWNDLRYADGAIIKEVGIAGDLEAETDAILLKYDLNVTPYSQTLKQFLPPISFKISDFDIQSREDFRKECLFTIDPETARDLDDAVSCKLLPNGNFEVGVHVSDVTYFLPEGTPLDKAVSERATTVYLVQETYHMLPFELCKLCSLTPGEDKLSFSVIWEITPDCQIINHRFARSIINSCAQLTYDQVQALLDNMPLNDLIIPKIYNGYSIEHIKEIVLILNKIAISLRSERFRNGALKIDQKKIYFSLDENKLPINYKEEIHEPSHQLIEELMLLANGTVAKKLLSSFPELAFLRCQPPPLPHILEKLQKTLEKFGIIVDISSSASLQASLLKYSGHDTESVARMLVLTNALAKPMARAKYYCAGLHFEETKKGHYALNTDLYTHFTSPIRRYADVMVHRLLAASLHYCDPPKWESDYVQSVAACCNKQKYAAKMAQEMSVELYFAIFVGLQGNLVCEAVVCDIKDKSFDCIGLATGIHQRLYFKHIKGDLKSEKDDGIIRLTIKWPKDENHESESVQIIEIFSIVQLELKRVNVLKIEAELLRCQ